MTQFTKTLRNESIFEIMLDKPPANAIDHQMSCDLYDAFKELNNDDSLRVGILSASTNNKNIFCGGWDLKAFAKGDGRDQEGGFDLGPGGIGGLPEFWDMYKPVVAAVDGLCVGGGFEMVLGADLIIASENTEFWLPEMQRGFIPDGGGIQKLHHRIPYNVALDMILTGRRMSAQEAKHWGLVRDVVSKDNVRKKAYEVAQLIADGAPLVSKALKEFMRYNANLSPEMAHKNAHKAWARMSNMAHYEKMLNSDDFNEGAVAFAEKRPPKFKGS